MPDLTGRELDVEVARVTGREIRFVADDDFEFTRSRDWLSGDWLDVEENNAVAHYSTDANAALAAYAVIRERGWWITYCEHDQDGWPLRLEDMKRQLDVWANGSTFAEALARAIVAAGNS